LVVAIGAALLCVLGGCGGRSSNASTTNGLESSTTQSASLDSGATNSIADVFVELARVAAPMPIYGWKMAPEGMGLVSHWLPLLEQQDPASYDGSSVDNPRVSSGNGRDPEIQVVLTYRGGWVVVVENFRGDLGDVTGTDVGAVGGRAATLYEVNGGHLVQWSDGGRWYGVFGRQVPTEELVALALSMVPPPAGVSR
jgi:hypothetical protein